MRRWVSILYLLANNRDDNEVTQICNQSPLYHLRAFAPQKFLQTRQSIMSDYWNMGDRKQMIDFGWPKVLLWVKVGRGFSYGH